MRSKAEAHEFSQSEQAAQAEQFIAKKDFQICQNGFFRDIKVGDDLSDMPERFYENLKTEGVL